MRNTKINIYGASQKERIKLYDHLIALGEEIYEDTKLRDSEYKYSLFNYSHNTKRWSSGGYGGNSKNTLFINEFIEKYPVLTAQSSNYQYKPGDKVRVIPTLNLSTKYDIYINHEMVKEANKVFTLTIKAGTAFFTGKPFWKFKENRFDWTEDLFELVEEESEKDYAIICKDSALKDRKLIYSHLQSLNYKMYEGTYFIANNNFTSSFTVYTYHTLQWETNDKSDIPKHIKLISVKDFIAKFIKTSKQTTSVQDSSVQIGQKYKNSVGTINIITKVTNTKVLYQPKNGSREYSCTVENVKKNWKLITEAENTQTPTTYQIIKKDKYEVGAKVKIREDLKRHHNVTTKMCKLAGTIVVITQANNFDYKFKEGGTYYWTRGMFEGEVIEPQIESQPIISQEPKEEQSTMKHLAFFKESGEPWTEAELDSVRAYCGDFASRMPMGSFTPKRKYAYYTEKTNSGLKVYLWDDQIYPEKLKQVSYESIFETSPKDQPKTNAESAQAEQIKQSKPTIEREKKSMAKAIKETAIATLDQNKQAAIIAAKMEAGRVLNKQVIKQIKPHIPMFVRGYLDTPLAPVVVANLVAAIGNHTQNKRVQQVSELMLLAAADTTVQSFNLDKIIDDVLSGVKLPAGILDTDEE